MKIRLLALIGFLEFSFILLAHAGNAQRINHSTFVPRHLSPDDKGMYTAFIDVTNGYAYFVGNYLTKVDITVDPPQPVGTAILAGQPGSSAIDVDAGIAYLAKSSLTSYSLGAGANPVTLVSSLSLSAGNAEAVVLDDSDANPTNHYAYVLCAVSGAEAKVAKVALSNFTELNSVTLTNQTNFLFGTVADPKKGYAYFVSSPPSNAAPVVVKVKMTPGASPPLYVGSVSLNTLNEFIDGGSIDTVHGYAYFGSYSSDTNVTGKIYKVKLGDGDTSPSLVGFTSLQPGEGRLAASVLDPQNGFVYFGNDNSYPGGVYQLSLNGTNPAVEIGFLPFPGGPDTPPPTGTTAANVTTNTDGILPYGEVYFRSAVFDPLRGYAYFGQDSRPNQMVKLKVAQVDPFTLTGTQIRTNSFQFTFTNIPGASFSVLTTSNLATPLSHWTIVSNAVTEISSGQFQFIDTSTPLNPTLFYRVQNP